MRNQFALLALLFFLIPPTPSEAQFDIYVADFDDVVRIDANGNSSTFISGLDIAVDLTIDIDGNFLIAENVSNQIRKFAPNGTDLGVFATVSEGVIAIDVDQNGSVYAGTDAGSIIRKFDRFGNFLFDFSAQGDVSDIIFDINDDLFVSDVNGDSIWKFDTDGNGKLFASLNAPNDMAFSPTDDNLYVTQLFEDRIVAISPAGVHLGVFALGGLDNPVATAFDPFGNFYVGDNDQNNIRKFSPNGDDLGIFATGVTVPVGMIIVSTIPEPDVLLGDVNLDGSITFLDILPFILIRSSQGFQVEADIDKNGVVNFLDIQPFIDILAAQ